MILANELASRARPVRAAAASAQAVPPALRAKVAPLMAEAFGATFWYALALVVVAFVVAIVLLPKHKPEIVEEDPVAGEPEAAALVLVH